MIITLLLNIYYILNYNNIYIYGISTFYNIQNCQYVGLLNPYKLSLCRVSGLYQLNFNILFECTYIIILILIQINL